MLIILFIIFINCKLIQHTKGIYSTGNPSRSLIINKGAYVDNETPGGISSGINTLGMLNQFAVDKYYKKYYKHPYTGIPFENTQIPKFSSLLDFAKNLHRYLLYFDMVSWD